MFVTMDWQEIAALTMVGATAAAFVWRKLRPPVLKFQRGSLQDSHCGCSTASIASPRQTIIYRARRGQTPQVIVKTR